MDFKRRITPEQLAKLSDTQWLNLWDWWKPQIGDLYINYNSESEVPQNTITKGIYRWNKFDQDYFATDNRMPILDIGQMIEMLNYKDDCLVIKFWEESFKKTKPKHYEIATGKYGMSDSNNLCDALWQAVKDLLAKEENLKNENHS